MPRKLLILGAAGDMGSYAYRLSIKFDIYSEITIGDIDEKRAHKVMEQFKDPRVKFVKVNAFNHAELVALMEKHDIIISCIGPFYIFGPLVAKAAIEAKRPLVDICDDYGPTQEVLKMDDQAKAAGIPIFLGYGWTPGISNILARYGYEKLDKNSPIRINVAWVGGAKDSEGLAVIMHVLYAVDGLIPSFLNGKLTDVKAGEGHQTMFFPKPIGTVTVFDCGHPEPVTIPKYLKGVEECTLKGGLTPDWNNEFAASMKQLHLIQGPKRKKFMANFVHTFESMFASGGIAASSDRVDLFGKIKGKDVHLAYSTPSIPMGDLTGYPAAIAARLYAEGKIGGKGVIPPETLDPKLFLGELEKIGIKMIYDDKGTPEILGELKPTTLKFWKRYGFSITLLGIPLLLILLIILLIIIF